jgi:predicted nucleic acid-binding protein
VKAFPDTSFLCSFYRRQEHTPRALAWMKSRHQPLLVSSLLILEFKQLVRLQNFLFKNDRTRGFPERDGSAMIRDLQTDLAGGLLKLVAPDWAEVHRLAEELSGKHTADEGHRLADLLHLATAKYLGSEVFLSFDERQRTLAVAEGMTLAV